MDTNKQSPKQTSKVNKWMCKGGKVLYQCTTKLNTKLFCSFRFCSLVIKGKGKHMIYKSFINNLCKENSRLLTANIWQFSIIYILAPPINTITLYTSVQCWICKHIISWYMGVSEPIEGFYLFKTFKLHQPCIMYRLYLNDPVFLLLVNIKRTAKLT